MPTEEKGQFGRETDSSGRLGIGGTVVVNQKHLFHQSTCRTKNHGTQAAPAEALILDHSTEESPRNAGCILSSPMHPWLTRLDHIGKQRNTRTIGLLLNNEDAPWSLSRRASPVVPAGLLVSFKIGEDYGVGQGPVARKP